MKRDGISIENEACRSYVNMEQTGNMWELQLSLIHISEPTRPY
mgnify:CR=1 FL=1